ncbi:dTDP-glucose 4,6-dehydratase [Candidatus Gottesmanbacteria bacterium]|nr:dTDP-glucose 4,6-dehydratase [Candidatus Gottesmanbacteria bacterium]
MKLFVTGGAGFIGSNFILYWMKKYPNDKIVNFDKLTYAGNLENLTAVSNNPNYYFVKGDICNKKEVEEGMDGSDIVVNFAAESHVDRSITDPSIFAKTNVLGTQVLLEVALKYKIARFHHISTDEVFGTLPLDSDEKFNEQTPKNPRSPYAATKAASDHLLNAYNITYGLNTTITNCSNNYGPYQFPEKLIPLAITNLLEGKKVPVYGDGKYVRDWLYVNDHCRAIDAVLKNGIVGEVYCVGGLNTDISNLEIVKKIIKILGKDEGSIEFVKDRPGHDRKYAVDWRKIKQELGWEPKHDMEFYLEETVKWYKNNSSWWKRLKKVVE